MTFIQPNKDSSLLNKILIILIIGLFLGAIWLIILYNGVVNLGHGISDTKTGFQEVLAQNTELKNKLVTMLNTSALNDLAHKNNLIQDKNPKYFQINPQWSYASQY